MTASNHNPIVHMDRITRVEVISNSHRDYTNMHVYDVELHMQDEGKTLKIFLKDQNGL